MQWRWTKWIVAALALGLALETLAAWPNYLAFFNLPSGGARGGIKLLADSNLDWGQDLIALANWRKAHNDKPLYPSYFATPDPEYYGVQYFNVMGGNPFLAQPHLWDLPTDRQAYLVVSVTNVQTVYMNGAEMTALKGLQPRDIINGTIYVYDWPLPTGPVLPPKP